MIETWTEQIEIGEKSYQIKFVQRPFREGLEVEFEINGEVVRIAELGLGREALIHRIEELISQ